MPPRQRTFELVPETLVKQNVQQPRRMTSKQVKKAYKEANKVPKISRAEQRRRDQEELERHRKEYAKQQAAEKAKAVREKKAAKLHAEKEARKKKGIPEPSKGVGASQPRISMFINKADRRTSVETKNTKNSVEEDLDETLFWDDAESAPSGKRSASDAFEDGASAGRPQKRVASETSENKTEFGRKAALEESDDEFGGFPSLSQDDIPIFLEEIDHSMNSTPTHGIGSWGTSRAATPNMGEHLRKALSTKAGNEGPRVPATGVQPQFRSISAEAIGKPVDSYLEPLRESHRLGNLPAKTPSPTRQAIGPQQQIVAVQQQRPNIIPRPVQSGSKPMHNTTRTRSFHAQSPAVQMLPKRQTQPETIKRMPPSVRSSYRLSQANKDAYTPRLEFKKSQPETKELPVPSQSSNTPTRTNTPASARPDFKQPQQSKFALQDRPVNKPPRAVQVHNQFNTFTRSELKKPPPVSKSAPPERSVNMPPPALLLNKTTFKPTFSKPHASARLPTTPKPFDLPPSSTQAFLETHLEDFLPSPSQEIRELAEEEAPSQTLRMKQPFPLISHSKLGKMENQADSSVLMFTQDFMSSQELDKEIRKQGKEQQPAAFNDALNLMHPPNNRPVKNQDKTKEDLTSFFCTQDLMSAEELHALETSRASPSKAQPGLPVARSEIKPYNDEDLDRELAGLCSWDVVVSSQPDLDRMSARVILDAAGETGDKISTNENVLGPGSRLNERGTGQPNQARKTRKGLFFEEKEEDVIQAVLHQSIATAKETKTVFKVPLKLATVDANQKRGNVTINKGAMEKGKDRKNGKRGGLNRSESNCTDYGDADFEDEELLGMC